MKRSGFIIIFLFYVFASAAQSGFGVLAGAGWSQFDVVRYPSDVSLEATIYYQPAVKAGLFYNYQLRNGMLFGADILYAKLSGKMDFYSYGGFAAYWSRGTARLGAHSTGGEVYVGYLYKKVLVSIGVQALYAIRTSYRESGEYFNNGTIQAYNGSITRNATRDHYYDLGLSGEFNYSVTPR